LLSFLLAIIAIGPYRVQAWIKWASPSRSTSTAVPPTADPVSAVGVYREAVGETHRDPRQVEEETDEEFLIRRCRELAQELYDFLDEHNYSKFEDLNDPKVIQRDSKALKLYNRRLRPEVANLLKRLKARGLYPPEGLASHQQSSIEKTLSLWAVERLANVLNEIGHDW
jgi:beta-phosphoglucomutase-like phosphatase (HAD superfamily)